MRSDRKQGLAHICLSKIKRALRSERLIMYHYPLNTILSLTEEQEKHYREIWRKNRIKYKSKTYPEFVVEQALQELALLNASKQIE